MKHEKDWAAYKRQKSTAYNPFTVCIATPNDVDVLIHLYDYMHMHMPCLEQLLFVQN